MTPFSAAIPLAFAIASAMLIKPELTGLMFLRSRLPERHACTRTSFCFGGEFRPLSPPGNPFMKSLPSWRTTLRRNYQCLGDSRGKGTAADVTSWLRCRRHCEGIWIRWSCVGLATTRSRIQFRLHQGMQSASLSLIFRYHGLLPSGMVAMTDPVSKSTLTIVRKLALQLDERMSTYPLFIKLALC